MQMETCEGDVQGRGRSKGGARHRRRGDAAENRGDVEDTPGSSGSSNARTKTNRRRTSRQKKSQEDADIDILLNYGSEDDSDMEDDGDNEDGKWPMFLPRAERDVFYDDDEESMARGPELKPLDASRFPASPSLTTPLLASSIPASPSLASPSPATPSLATPLLATPSLASQSLANVFGSNHLFDFDWRDIPNPPVLMATRREVFSETNSGPTATAPYRTPYDAFTAIWTPEFMEYIVRETNRYGQEAVAKMNQEHGRTTSWYNTNVNELYVFFGLLVATGLCVKGEVEDYWSTKDGLATPNFKRCMSMNRFVMLSNCLHFNNNANLQKMTRPQAKLSKIAPVVEHLNQRFQSLYTIGRNVALDSSVMQWKGSSDINKLIKNKTATSGIRIYEVCESMTGYLWRFKVHDEREEVSESETPESSVAPIVLELLRGLENKGYTVWMDCDFNSPVLARVLKFLGIDCVGTLKTTCRYLPPQLAVLDKSDMEIGQIYGFTSGDVDVMVWRDKNRFAFISTYHGVGVHTDSDGISKPMAVRDYNLYMSGIDKKNQMLSAYPIERERTQIWYKKLFRHLLNTSILNAFILYRLSSPDIRGRINKHRDFRKILLGEIMANNFYPTDVVRPNSNPTALTLEMFDHLPLEYGLVTDRGRGREKSRRACVFCHKRVSTYCPVCNVTLCLTPCYKSYHAKTFNLYP